MNSKERIRTALELGEPDRVPHWELAYNESSIVGVAARFMDPADLPEPKLALDMTGEEKVKIIGALSAFVKELDIDGVTALPLPPRERVDEEHARDAFGIVSHLSPLGEPHPVEGPIGDMSDLRGYKMRRPEDGDFLMLDVLRQTFPDRALCFDTQATFRMGWGLRGGMEKLLMDYMLSPDLAKGLARMVTDYILESVEIAIKKGADWIMVDGDLAFNTGPLMSPAHYDEFIGPYHAEITELVHKNGLRVTKHSDGNMTPLLPNLIEAGFDGFHPIQPQCMDIGATKRDFGGRLCLIGNIDCSELLVFGSEDEVERVVKETIEKAAPGGGYILSSSNSIHPEVKPDNYIAMVRAAHKHGTPG